MSMEHFRVDLPNGNLTESGNPATLYSTSHEPAFNKQSKRDLKLSSDGPHSDSNSRLSRVFMFESRTPSQLHFWSTHQLSIDRVLPAWKMAGEELEKEH